MGDDALDRLRDPQTGELMSTAARYRAGPSAKMLRRDEYDRDVGLTCHDCRWRGLARDADHETFEDVFDVSCPRCGQMLLIVG